MFDPGYGIRLRCSVRTDTGKVRDNNEDSVGFHTFGDDTILAVVADGMGGAVAGEEASRIAVETIKSKMTDPDMQPEDGDYNGKDQDELIKWMQSIIIGANNNIVDRAIKQPELKGMGTTVTMALIFDINIIIGHVGDSRAYLVDGSDGDLMQITSDHSFVQALVAAGHITEEEAEEHPMKNVLYRALGQAREVEVDISIEQIHVGDRLVLCSDGLTLHVKPHEIAELAMEDDPDECSRKLIELANERGGRDNISVIVIKAEADNTVKTRPAKSQIEIDTLSEKDPGRATKIFGIPNPPEDKVTNDDENLDVSDQLPPPQYLQDESAASSRPVSSLISNNQNSGNQSSKAFGEGRDNLLSD